MSKPGVTLVRVERHSANDDEYKLINFPIAEGATVREGDCIAVLEGSKAAFEVLAPASGFIRYAAQAGDNVAVGGLLAQIAPSTDIHLQAETIVMPVDEPAELSRFTKKARALIAGRTVDLKAFQGLEVVTEQDVKHVLMGGKAGPVVVADELALSGTGKVERLALLGAGRGTIQVIDIVLRNKHQTVVRLYDDNEAAPPLMGMSVAGKIDPKRILDDYQAKQFDKVICTVNVTSKIRAMLYDKIAVLGIPFANAIHPSVSEGISVRIGQGNVICSHVSIGPCATIGDNNFISAQCNIEHHATIASHNAWGPGVMTSGGVRIGSRVRCGTGIFIEPNLSIGDDAIISSGAIVSSDVPANARVKLHSNISVRK